MQQKPKILIVDDDDAILKVLSLVLVQQGFEVVTATDGQVAEERLKAMAFHAVITDMNMPGHGGLELLKHVRGTYPQLPVILMTGFTKIIETKTAFELGAQAFLAKPFQQAELIEALRKVLTNPSDESATEVAVAPVEDYCRIGIDQFISGKSIKYEIFVRLESKYIKVAHAGEDINLERIHSYKAKGVHFLYIRRQDFGDYVGFSLRLSHAAKVSAAIPQDKKLRLARVASAAILENLFVNGLTEESFLEAKEIMTTTVALMTDSPDGCFILEALEQSGDSLYTHSLGVSLFSVLIAKKIGWDSPTVLFKISTAGLLHDIGMKEIDRAITEKPRSARTLEETKILETHASRGAAILASMPGISEEILQTVAQHHESFDGRGYPAKLSGGKIIPPARLLSVADQFCELVLADSQSDGIAPSLAFERLSQSITNTGDLVYLNALKQILDGKGASA